MSAEVIRFSDLLKRLDDDRLHECHRIATEQGYDEIRQQIETEINRRVPDATTQIDESTTTAVAPRA